MLVKLNVNHASKYVNDDIGKMLSVFLIDIKEHVAWGRFQNRQLNKLVKMTEDPILDDLAAYDYSAEKFYETKSMVEKLAEEKFGT